MEDRQSKTTVLGSVMVVGGGIAGMQAALDLANSGYYVYMLGKIAGHWRGHGPIGQDLPHQ